MILGYFIICFGFISICRRLVGLFIFSMFSFILFFIVFFIAIFGFILIFIFWSGRASGCIGWREAEQLWVLMPFHVFE